MELLGEHRYEKETEKELRCIEKRERERGTLIARDIVLRERIVIFYTVQPMRSTLVGSRIFFIGIGNRKEMR